jgi:hypothetical protein
MEQPPAGWYPDPLGGHPLRYWDGQHWTDHVSDGGPTTGFVAAPTAPPVAGVASKNRNVRWLISGGVAAVVVGALLPWAEVTAAFIGTVSKRGIEGDGVITLVLGVGAGLAAWRSAQGTGRKGFITGVVLAALIVATAVYTWSMSRRSLPILIWPLLPSVWAFGSLFSVRSP